MVKSFSSNLKLGWRDSRGCDYYFQVGSDAFSLHVAMVLEYDIVVSRCIPIDSMGRTLVFRPNMLDLCIGS